MINISISNESGSVDYIHTIHTAFSSDVTPRLEAQMQFLEVNDVFLILSHIIVENLTNYYHFTASWMIHNQKDK